MKRWMTAGAILLALLSCACARQTPVPVDAAASASPTASAPIMTATPTPAAETAAPVLDGAYLPRARQYGEPETLTADGNGFSGTLTYPQGGVQPVNHALADWASETLYTLETQAAKESVNESGMRAEMEIDYDAYTYVDRFIGVKQTGEYRALVSGQTQWVLYTYNYDLKSNGVMTLTDVVDAAQMEAVSALLTDRLRDMGATAILENGALTAERMQTFVIRDDGVEWLFLDGDTITGVLLDYPALAPYLTLTDAKSERVSGSSLAVAVVEQHATCLHDGVQLRTLPSASEGEVLSVAYAGDTLDIIKSNVTKGWHEVDYQHQIAFVRATLVQLETDDVAYTSGYVESAYLHVRALATTQSELLGTMVYQEPVRIVDPNAIHGWYKIWYEGQIAYVNAQYVVIDRYPPTAQINSADAALYETAETPRILRQTLAPIVGVGTCGTDGVIIRSAPNLQASAYGTLAGGEQVYILEEEYAAGWDRIFVYTEANSGYIGYVQSRYVASSVPNAVADASGS